MTADPNTRKTILLYLHRKRDVEYHELKDLIKTEFIDNGADYCKTAHSIKSMVKEGLIDPKDALQGYLVVCTSSGGKPSVDPTTVSFMLKLTSLGRTEVDATYLKEAETKEERLNRKWPISSQILVAIVVAAIIAVLSFLAGRLTAPSDNQGDQEPPQQTDLKKKKLSILISKPTIIPEFSLGLETSKLDLFYS